MMWFSGFRLTDPEDLAEWSNGAFSLYLQLQQLDFAWRYYKRIGDQKSKRKSEEIKKILREVSNLQRQGIIAYIPEDLMTKCSKLRMKWLYS